MTTSSLRQLRLGVIGTGLAIEKLHWPALARMRDRFDIVAFANHTRPKAEAFARLAGLSMHNYHADYADLLRRDDVDAVLIALPIPLLYPATSAALDAGKHVLCEKPPGANIGQARDFLALNEEYPQHKVLIGENFFYRDDLRLARSLLDQGAIGRPHLMTWHQIMQNVPREGSFSSTPWRQAPHYRGGPHLDAGVHHIAQMRLLIGDIQHVQAYVQYANPSMGGPSDLVLNTHFVNHAIGNYVAAYLATATPDEPNGMRLYGSDGELVIGNRGFTLIRPDGTSEEHVVQDMDGGYYNQLLNFYEAIVYGEPIVGTIAQSFVNLQVIMVAMDSAEEQRVLHVPAPPDGASEKPLPLWRRHRASGLFDGLPVQVQTTSR